jgi:hypothetical protein
MSMDHRPHQVRRGDEELRVAERPQSNQRATALIGRDPAAVYVHGQSRNPGRKRDDEEVVARLTLVFVLGPRPVSEPWPASECPAVHPPPGRLGIDPRRISQLIPLDTRSAEAVLQRFIK